MLTLSARDKLYCAMIDIDVLLNHARVRTRFACACVYELIKCMSQNKQFIIFIYYGSIINVSLYVLRYEVHV